MLPLRRALLLLLPLAALCALVLSGLACATLAPASNTPTPILDHPQLMCTPPACGPGEVYYCPGRCPGGCGTTCATPTPANVTPEAPLGAPCTVITRIPPPSAPTLVGDSTRQVNPHVALCASAQTLKVGESVTLFGQAVSIGLPYFNLVVRPAEGGDFQPWMTVTYANELKSQVDAGGPLEVVSMVGGSSQVTVVLRARAVGAIQVAINATGEVHYGYPGPAIWAGGGSDPLTLTVER